jgi:hypothetical protein
VLASRQPAPASSSSADRKTFELAATTGPAPDDPAALFAALEPDPAGALELTRTLFSRNEQGATVTAPYGEMRVTRSAFERNAVGVRAYGSGLTDVEGSLVFSAMVWASSARIRTDPSPMRT